MPTLSHLCSISLGLSLRTGVGADTGGVPVVQLRDVDWETGRVDWAALPTVSDIDPNEDRYLRAGDVLFAGKGQTHQAVLIAEDYRALAVAPFFVVRPMRDDVEPAYVAWYLNADPAQAHIHRCAAGAVGASIRSVSKKCLGSLPVPLPPLDVQRRIAEAVRLAAEERALAIDLAERKARLVDALCLRRLHTQV